MFQRIGSLEVSIFVLVEFWLSNCWCQCLFPSSAKAGTVLSQISWAHFWAVKCFIFFGLSIINEPCALLFGLVAWPVVWISVLHTEFLSLPKNNFLLLIWRSCQMKTWTINVNVWVLLIFIAYALQYPELPSCWHVNVGFLKMEDLGPFLPCHLPVWAERTLPDVFIALTCVCTLVLDTDLYFTLYNFGGQILPVHDTFSSSSMLVIFRQ